MRSYNNQEQQFHVSAPPPGKEDITESKSSQASGIGTTKWIALALCATVMVAGVLMQFVGNRQEYGGNPTPDWIPLVAAVLAAAGIIQLNDRPRWLRMQGILLWSGLLLMVWTANGLIFDLLRLTPLIPIGSVDWAGMATRTLALAAGIVLSRLALARPAAYASNRAGTWYGYAAFVLALPYPVFRICWAFGGTIGIMYPGAAGSGFAPLLIAFPWMLAAALSLLLVSKRRILSRRVLLTAGWTATAIVAMIGPAAWWSMITQLITGSMRGPDGMKIWVPCLFYSSWFLWAIAAGAATRSYQLRTASTEDVIADVTNKNQLIPGKKLAKNKAGR